MSAACDSAASVDAEGRKRQLVCANDDRLKRAKDLVQFYSAQKSDLEREDAEELVQRMAEEGFEGFDPDDIIPVF